MKIEKLPDREKPPILYHGTNRSDIEEFTPNSKRVRDEKEGMLLFATPDKAFATMFLGPRADDSWSDKGKFNDVYYIVVADEEKFRKEDNGGTIFSFPSDSFACDENKGMGFAEWTTKASIKPTESENYESTLDAMIENGVQVYFVDKETFHKIKNADDHGMSILDRLQSENERIGKNIKKFE